MGTGSDLSRVFRFLLSNRAHCATGRPPQGMKNMKKQPNLCDQALCTAGQGSSHNG